jgi:CHAD domain-containing protein
VEVEAKFSVPDEQTFQRLLAATTLAGLSLGKGTTDELHDRYLDTASGALQAAGYACRERRQGERYLATLKGLGSVSGAVHRRVEHEVELAGPLPPRDWPPSAARDLVLNLSGGKPLTLLLRIEQTRNQRPLVQGGEVVAELNLDRVHIYRGDALAATHLELEAELSHNGPETVLETLASELEEVWGLAPEGLSKFERGMKLMTEDRGTLPAPPVATEIAPVEAPSAPTEDVELLEKPGIEPGDPMSEAGRKTFRFHYRRMLYNEPGTRLGEDIEALHDMRVATRRMRAAFRTFGDHYKPKAVAPYLKGLRRTGRALGRVRDLDVFREKVQLYQGTLPESQQDSLDSLLAALEARREAARERMITYLDDTKYARFRERFGEFVETEGMGSRPVALDGGEPRPYRVRHVAPVVIYERLAVVRAYDEWVNIPDPPLERLHALRIACKRLRYTLEFFGEVLGPEAKTAIDEVVVMQDHLGALQDTVVASSILGDFLQWGTWGHDADRPPPDQETQVSAPGVEAYLAAQQAEMKHLLDTFPEAWQRLKGAEFSRMLAQAVFVL